MEIFTEIEFSRGEFEKVHKVLYFLTKEGWEITNTLECSTTKPGQEKEIKAIKYKLRREI
jgi:hypothetical protein